MKKMLQIVFTFILGIVIFLIPNSTAKAEEVQETNISSQNVKILVENTAPFAPSFWANFTFNDMGDGSVRLRSDSRYSNNIVLGEPYLVRFYDNEGSVYYSKQFTTGYRVNDFANEIGNVKMRYGLDSFQIEWFSNLNMVKIDGTVKSNLDYQNFSTVSKEAAKKYALRVERDGLYAQYINQVRISDGEYVIQTAGNTNKVLDVLYELNAGVGTYDKNRVLQKFKLIYDNLHKAYKIRVDFNNTVLNWQSSQGTNVDYTSDRNYSEQFWYLQSLGNGKYNLVNARNTNKYLNLDANGVNISVDDKRNNIHQEFKLVNSEDINIVKGEYKIVSKLNNHKVVNVHIGGINPNNVTIWDDANQSQQKWGFKYDNNLRAYKIHSVMDENKVLARVNGTGSNVFVYDNIPNAHDQYWILEDVGDGYYIFKNYQNQNMVLDLYGSNTNNGSNIQVHERTNTDNQKFKLIR